EGLDNGAVLNSNFIVVVNDNDQSIAENHGGLYDNLKLLRETNGKAECNFFKSLGFNYILVKEGNNIEKLIEAFKDVKDSTHPVVVHICTQKGKGCKAAEENRENYHWILPGTLDEDKPAACAQEDYTSITRKYILNKAKTDKTVIAINAGTPGVFGFDKSFREEMCKQYLDVGIAEEHAVACASGIATGGAKPIFTVMSSFIQRTYDQMSQDLCLNKAPITMLVYWGGISGADATHLCTFDIPLISNIPNMVYLAPTNKEEYLKMLDWSVEQTEYPVAIRVPMTELISTGIEDKTDYSNLNKFKVESNGEKVAILGVGNFYSLAEKVAANIKSKLGFEPTVINPRFITGLDKELLDSLKSNHSVVITLEDGVINGGFGEKVASYYGNTDMKILNYGALKEFTDRVSLDELYKRYRLTPELIIEDIEKLI
ncbi:MAG: 1-deoxy-D-xylulose-5-phosphate synthase, partial [Candidatus Gastranaerophilales bacterium]|nr:1-deoxy-D-xylulose-5-phosphate synthase [Candidatus Gastranaerophilales bacterium]